MSDLVKRLRYIVKHVTAMTDEVKNACHEAADELERQKIEYANKVLHGVASMKSRR